MLRLHPKVIHTHSVSLFCRNASSSSGNSVSSSARLTCGLEIHAQLKTPFKLFSDSRTSFHEHPNSQVSFYDAALPGTQPVFNQNVLLPAFKAALALNCKIRPKFSFDRKHYFYGDQPNGYQVTQFYEPYASDGKMHIYPRDGVPSPFVVRIKQIQLEQDTGKSTYIDSTANIDLNRSNTTLIEMVTEPDIPTPEAAGVFVKKLQMLLRHLGVCSGELESGAMRVDVNVSVNAGQRCEIKNLSTISAVVHAIKAEFKRQQAELAKGNVIESETRGWDGRNTWKLRGKEEGVDYRYMPDPELPEVYVPETVVEQLSDNLPELPDAIFAQLLESPYSVPLVDARTLMNTEGLVDYYHQVFDYFINKGGKKTSLVSNWIVHRLWGEITSNALTSDTDTNEHSQTSASTKFSQDILPVSTMGDILLRIDQSKITSTSGSIILKHYIKHASSIKNNHKNLSSVDELITQFNLGKVQEASPDVQDAVLELCKQVAEANPDVVERVKSGKKPKSIMFLVGQVMRQSQGRLDPKVVEQLLRQIICK